ncbi:WXG100 family type VII secretion target [Amycolatopsis benzoatilytica]|uniref:WXG100 family type VII secretion target n=1 Tax=Amycolatopsis benzoatilytica TaxID=346045 RepID=UPI00036AF1BF|nr:WXG100 family type VII secretion target [Amycolatopsis benzoatilytica]
MTEPSLAYVTELARELGVTDPVAAYYRPLTGRWEELDAEAERLRAAARTAARISTDLADDLGRIDASWSGPDADAFVAYMGEIRAASEGAEDALDALAGSLDQLTESMRKIAAAAEEILVDAADLLSESAMLPSGGASRARSQMRETGESLKSLCDSAEDVLQEFGRLCSGVDAPPGSPSSIELRHHYPAQQFRLHDADGPAGAPAPNASAAPAAESSKPGSQAVAQEPVSAAESSAASAGESAVASSAADAVSPSAAENPHPGKETAADPNLEQGQAVVPPPEPIAPAPQPAAAANQGGGMSMMPMMPMMGGGGGGGGGATHKPKQRAAGKASEIFGEPAQVTPPVIGEDPPAKRPEKGGKTPKPGK